MATLYIHIPFCKQICSYCDFYRVGAVSLINDVIANSHVELEQRKEYIANKPLTSIYFGGGTPSLVAPHEIEQIVDHARRLFDCTHLTEITIEANPDDLNDDYVTKLAQTSVNRVSLGIQSFDDEALQLMNRRHNAHEAEEAVARLKRAGIDNISIDLIFGIAGYGGKSLEESLQRAIALGVGHISAYHLTIEPNTRLGLMTRRGEYTPIAEELSEREFQRVHHTLTAAGYEHYEVSNFALKGCRAQHNSAYWTGVEYLGIGAGAHSFDGKSRTWCVSTAKEYANGIFRYEGEVLTRRDHLNEYVMTSLRRIEGIDLSYIAECFGEGELQRIEQASKRWLTEGVLTRHGSNLAIPAEKFLISDAVIESLFD